MTNGPWFIIRKLYYRDRDRKLVKRTAKQGSWYGMSGTWTNFAQLAKPFRREADALAVLDAHAKRYKFDRSHYAIESSDQCTYAPPPETL